MSEENQNWLHDLFINEAKVAKNYHNRGRSGEYVTETELKGLVNPLYGKRLACCGDSVMEARTDETSSQCNGGAWSAIIGERNSMTVENRGRGGSTLCNYYYKDTGTYSNSHTINRQIELIAEDADYIIFNGWVNDFHRNEVIGEITSGYSPEFFNKDTILGGLEFICYTLSTKFAGKKYGYLFNHRSYYDTAEQSNIGTKLHLKIQIKKVLEKWGVPYLDLENMIPSLYFIPSLRELYTGEADGVHPNKEGYELFYCDKIEAWMKNALGYSNDVVEEEKTTYEITVSVSPENGGMATGGNTYEDGAQVMVTATANDGYKFAKWTENGVEVSTSATYIFTAEKDTTLMAVFEEATIEPEISYTNLVPTSINADGTQYGWDQDEDGTIDPEYTGCRLGARLSSSGVEKSAGLYSLITGFMPATSGATVRAKGANISLGHGSSYFCVYDANFAFLGGMALNGTNYDSTHDVIGNIELDTTNDMATIALNSVDTIAYIRINSAGDGTTSQVGNTMIVTVNEEII